MTSVALVTKRFAGSSEQLDRVVPFGLTNTWVCKVSWQRLLLLTVRVYRNLDHVKVFKVNWTGVTSLHATPMTTPVGMCLVKRIRDSRPSYLSKSSWSCTYEWYDANYRVLCCRSIVNTSYCEYPVYDSWVSTIRGWKMVVSSYYVSDLFTEGWCEPLARIGKDVIGVMRCGNPKNPRIQPISTDRIV